MVHATVKNERNGSFTVTFGEAQINGANSPVDPKRGASNAAPSATISMSKFNPIAGKKKVKAAPAAAASSAAAALAGATVKGAVPDSVTSAKEAASAATKEAKEAEAEAAAASPTKSAMKDAASNMAEQALIMTQQATMMQNTNRAKAKTAASAYKAAKAAYEAAKTAYEAAKGGPTTVMPTITPHMPLSLAYKTAMRDPVNNVINVAIEVQNTIEYLYQLIKTRDNDKDMMQLIRTFDNLAGKVLKAAEAVKKVTDKKMANNTTASSSSSSSSLDPLASVGLHVDNMIVHAGKMVTTATGIRSLTDPNALRAALNTFNAPFILFNEDMTQLNTLISKSGGRRTRSLRKNRRSKRTKRNKRSKRTQRNKRSKRTKRKHTK